MDYKDNSHKLFLDSLLQDEIKRGQTEILKRLELIVELLTALHKELYRFRTGE